MDAWEAFFTEKSRRRARVLAWRTTLFWIGISCGLMLLIMGLLSLLQL